MNSPKKKYMTPFVLPSRLDLQYPVDHARESEHDQKPAEQEEELGLSLRPGEGRTTCVGHARMQHPWRDVERNGSHQCDEEEADQQERPAAPAHLPGREQSHLTLGTIA